MSLSKVYTYYLNCLPPFLCHSVFCSFITGLELKTNGPFEKAQYNISSVTYGVIFGCFYPAIASYTLYKKYKE